MSGQNILFLATRDTRVHVIAKLFLILEPRNFIGDLGASWKAFLMRVNQGVFVVAHKLDCLIEAMLFTHVSIH